MSDSIRTINGKKIVGLLTRLHVANLQETEIKTNGEYAPEEGYDGFSKVIVNVPNSTQEKTITANGTYKPESPNVGFSTVTVAIPLQEKEITENGEYTPDDNYEAFSKVVISVPVGVKTINVDFPGMENIFAQQENIKDDNTGLTHTIYRCERSSVPKSYDWAGIVDSCVINGKEISSTGVEIHSVKVGLGTATYSAKFVDGILTTWSHYSLYTIKPVTDPLSVDPLSTSATMTIT